MYWSCDNRPVNGTQHQFGFARVPGIHREDENDTRQVAILPMTKETDLAAIIASEGKLELFADSPCVGTSDFSPDGLEFIEFRYIYLVKRLLSYPVTFSITMNAKQTV